MSKKLEVLVANCVLNNTLFTGQVGSAYTVQDLIHTASMTTIDKMGVALKKSIAALDTGSFSRKNNTDRRKALELKYDTLEVIYEWRVLEAKAKREATRLAEERSKKLDVLKSLRTEKEMEALGKLSLKDLEKEIASISQV